MQDSMRNAAHKKHLTVAIPSGAEPDNPVQTLTTPDYPYNRQVF